MFSPKTWIICRVCLKQQDELYNIFENIYLENIWSILRDCGGVPVQRNDGFPDKICEKCLKSLWKANIFRKDCQRAHREILQIFLDKSVEVCELELKNEKDNCSDIFQISDTSSFRHKGSNTSTSIFKVSQSISIKSKQSPNSNIDLPNSKTSLYASMQTSHILSGNDETINQLKNVKNEYESKKTKAVDVTHNSMVKRYCVVAKKNSTDQFVKPEQKDIKEPIVLLLKLENNEDETTTIENTPTKTNNRTKENKNSKKSRNFKNNKILNKNSSSLKKKSVSKKLSDLQKSITYRRTNSKNTLKCNKSEKNKNSLCCKKCKKSFNTFVDLRHHMYTHNRPHQCKICKKRFSQILALAGHTNTHLGKKPFYCRVCNKTFADITNRNSHERSLHAQRKFNCTICNKVFRFQSLLRMHSQSHRPKICFICNKEFSTISIVRSHHQRIHLKSLYNKK